MELKDSIKRRYCLSIDGVFLPYSIKISETPTIEMQSTAFPNNGHEYIRYSVQPFSFEIDKEFFYDFNNLLYLGKPKSFLDNNYNLLPKNDITIKPCDSPDKNIILTEMIQEGYTFYLTGCIVTSYNMSDDDKITITVQADHFIMDYVY